jgi:hypothetical protein
MKQRISVEQLYELNEHQQNKLRELWHPKDDSGEIGLHIIEGIFLVNYTAGNHIYDAHEREFIKEHCLPLLNIGQMIELLGINMVSCVQYVTPAWAVHCNAKEYCGVELCDALWEAIKSIL